MVSQPVEEFPPVAVEWSGRGLGEDLVPRTEWRPKIPGVVPLGVPSVEDDFPRSLVERVPEVLPMGDGAGWGFRVTPDQTISAFRPTLEAVWVEQYVLGEYWWVVVRVQNWEPLWGPVFPRSCGDQLAGGFPVGTVVVPLDLASLCRGGSLPIPVVVGPAFRGCVA